jgi:hypothetical protein
MASPSLNYFVVWRDFGCGEDPVDALPRARASRIPMLTNWIRKRSPGCPDPFGFDSLNLFFCAALQLFEAESFSLRQIRRVQCAPQELFPGDSHDQPFQDENQSQVAGLVARNHESCKAEFFSSPCTHLTHLAFFDAEATHQIAQSVLIRLDLRFDIGEERAQRFALVQLGPVSKEFERAD